MSMVILSAEGVEPIRFDGSQSATGFILRSLSGWLGSTSAKVDLVERAAGDGAHDVQDAQLNYSARTMSVEYRLMPDAPTDRSGLLAMQTRIRCLLHRRVTVQVIDADRDLHATGYVDSIDVQQATQNVNRQFLEGQINIVCPRPELCSTDMQLVQLLPLDSSGAGEGLSYGDQLETHWEGEPNNSVSVLSITPGSQGLEYPINYGRPGGDTRNCGTLTNRGSAQAWPVVSVEGDFPHGVSLQLDGAHTITYALPVAAVAPLTLDWRSRTASVNGADMTKWLTRREFTPVEPGSSVSIVLRSGGTGYVTVRLADTYM